MPLEIKEGDMDRLILHDRIDPQHECLIEIYNAADACVYFINSTDADQIVKYLIEQFKLPYKRIEDGL